MFGRRRIEVFVLLLVWARKAVHADAGREVLPLQYLNQEEAEIILAAETALRRHFIESFSKLQDKIFQFHSFHSVVDRILRGLRSRDLNPLKSFTIDFTIDSNQSAAHRVAAVIYSLQGCSSQETNSFAAWHSLLQTIPDIGTIVPPPPDTQLSPHHLHKPNPLNSSYLPLVLLAIHQHHLTPSNPLIAHILYNYPFKHYTPDLNSAVLNVIHLLGATQPLIDTFRPNPATNERTSQILSDILKLLPRQHPYDFHIAQILSALSSSDNVGQLRTASTPWQVLHLIRDDDYPPDIVMAANELAAAIENNQVSVDTGSFRGYSPLETLLGMISHLTAIPPVDPLSAKVHAIYPHVKLRYLSFEQKFFRPRSSSDVAFLLNSFLTVPTAAFIGEVRKLFLLPDFNWRAVLENFDYSKYSKPRPLIMDMLQDLLKHPDKLPSCNLIMLNYFLRHSRQVPTCAPARVNEDALNWKPKGPTVPLSVFDLTDDEFTPKATETPCADGPLIEMIDPESIIEIINPDDQTAFIADLISSNPMPADSYHNKTRLAVYRQLLNNLGANGYSDNATAFLIQQALGRIPLTEKAHLPPTYLHLCSSQTPTTPLSPSCEQTFIIDKESIIEIAKEDPNFDKIKRLLSSQAIHYEEYKHLTTREQVLRAFLNNRRNTTSPAEQLEITQTIPRLVISSDGQLQPLIRQQCPTIPLPSASPNPLCKPPSAIKTVIDPLSLLEIIQTDVQPIQRLLSKVPLLTDKYLNLGNRSDILLYFLKEHYSLCNETGFELPQLQINHKGNLPPLLKQKCVITLLLAPPQTLSPPLPITNTCSPQETPTAIYDTESVFEALTQSTPTASLIQKLAKAHPIPFHPKQTYTKPQVLQIILNTLAATTTDHKILKDINDLKSHIVCRKDVPTATVACLPKNVLQKHVLLGDECQAHETSVPLLNTDTIFSALSPNAPAAPPLRARIKTFIVPVNANRTLTKAEVLRNVLSHMEEGADSESRTVLAALKDSIMSTGPGKESPDVIHACMSQAVMESISTSEKMWMMHPTSLLDYSSTATPDSSVPPPINPTSFAPEEITSLPGLFSPPHITLQQQQLPHGTSPQPHTLTSMPRTAATTPPTSTTPQSLIDFTFSPSFTNTTTAQHQPTSTISFPPFSSLPVAPSPAAIIPTRMLPPTPTASSAPDSLTETPTSRPFSPNSPPDATLSSENPSSFPPPTSTSSPTTTTSPPSSHLPHTIDIPDSPSSSPFIDNPLSSSSSLPPDPLPSYVPLNA